MTKSKIKLTSEFAIKFQEIMGSDNSLYVDGIRNSRIYRSDEFELFSDFSHHSTITIDNNSIKNLKNESKKFDFIVADLAIRPNSIPWNGKYKLKENWAHILELQSILTDNGYALVWAEPSFWFRSNKRLIKILNDINFHLSAVINPPEESLLSFNSRTKFRPNILLFSSQKVEKVFIAELTDTQRVSNIISNFQQRKSGTTLKQGLYTDINKFVSFENFKVKDQIKNLKTNYEDYVEYKLSDLSKKIIIGKHKEKLLGMTNAIYLPKIGKSKIICNPKSATLNSQNYFQIQLDASIVINKYAALFFESELGNKIRDSLFLGTTISTITRKSLETAILIIPNLKEQQLIIDTNEKLERLKNEVDVISNELSINLKNANVLQDKIENTLVELSAFTNSDKVMAVIRKGESKIREFKQTLSLDIKTQTKEKYIEKAVLKTIAAFLNTDGGTLLIGVEDSGEILGIEREVMKLHKNIIDNFLIHYKNRVKNVIGEGFYPFINSKIVEVDHKKILMVKCEKSKSPCFINENDFFVRTNPATDKLEGPKLVQYIEVHFK
jgi:hypothetical protein